MAKKTINKQQNKSTNPLDIYLGYHLRRISAASMNSLAARLKDLDLRPSEAAVILFIEVNIDVSQTVTARYLGIEKPNMTTMVNRLESKKICRRKKLDGRSSGLKLTQHGIKLAQLIKKIIRENEQSSFGMLSPEKQQSLLETLRILGSDVYKIEDSL